MLKIPGCQRLVSLDLETTGLNVGTDHIYDFAAVEVFPDPTRKLCFQCKPFRRVIPADGYIPKVSYEELAHLPMLPHFAASLVEFLRGADLVGYNLINYDVPLLWEELNRCGVKWDISTIRIFDASVIFHTKEPRDLSGAVEFYCRRKHVDSHVATPDAVATADVFEAQLSKYKDLTNMSADTLHELCHRSKGRPRADLAGKLVKTPSGVAYAFGSKNGVLVKDDLSYANWILSADFPSQTKAVLRAELTRITAVQARLAQQVGNQ